MKRFFVTIEKGDLFGTFDVHAENEILAEHTAMSRFGRECSSSKPATVKSIEEIDEQGNPSEEMGK